MRGRYITALIMCSMGLCAKPSIDPEDITVSAGSLYTYGFIFSYDGSGNISRKVCSIPNYGFNRNNEENENSRLLIDDYEVAVNADRSWEHVTINIWGVPHLQDIMLNIFNTAGMECYASRLETGNTVINLSTLDRGVYIFRFNMAGIVKTYKLIKH